MELTDGLVGLWHMNNDWLDSSGNGNHGTAYGALFNPSGKLNQCGSFDGIDDYVNVPAFLNPTIGDWSYEVWVYPTSMPSVVAGLLGQINNDRNWFVYFYADGSLGVGIAGITELSSIAGVIVANRRWNHIVVVKSGNITTIYANNVSVASGTGGYWSDTTNPLRFGGIVYFNISYHLKGFIDEIAIWNRALSAAEIAELWNNGNGLELGSPQPTKYTQLERRARGIKRGIF